MDSPRSGTILRQFTRGWTERKKGLQPDDDMPRTLIGSFFNQQRDQPAARNRRFRMHRLIRSQEPSTGEHPLLRMALWEQVQSHRLGMLAQARFLVQFIGGSQAPQAIHLVAHLRGRNLGGLAQAFVQRT